MKAPPNPYLVLVSAILLPGSGQVWNREPMRGLTFLFFLASSYIARALGRTGIVVITRLLGMLLAALSVQFVLDGIKGTGMISGWAG